VISCTVDLFTVDKLNFCSSEPVLRNGHAHKMRFVQSSLGKTRPKTCCSAESEESHLKIFSTGFRSKQKSYRLFSRRFRTKSTLLSFHNLTGFFGHVHCCKIKMPPDTTHQCTEMKTISSLLYIEQHIDCSKSFIN
jgi:hypothetical protein